MIIDDLNIEGVAVFPAKTDPPLIIDANAMLAGPIAFELLQPVARWNPEILESLGSIDEPQLAKHRPVQLGREPAHTLALKDTLCLPIGEALNHAT